MAHTIVTNYSDLHPTDKDKSLVVVFDKDGSINLDKETLHNLISQPPDSTLLSFVRVTDDGKLDEHSDHSSDDGTVPHVSLTVDAFFQPSSEVFAEECNEEVLAPLEVDTHELFLEAFKNDHCYTSFLSPGEAAVKSLDGCTVVIDLENDIVTHSIPKPLIPNSKKIKILDQQIIPKGKSLISAAATEGKVVLKGADALRSSLTGFCPKHTAEKQAQIESKLKEAKDEESKDEEESSDESSSESATNDHESDSDYEDSTNRKLLIKPKAKFTPKPRVIRKASRAEITDTPTQPRKVLQGKNLNRKQLKAPAGLNVAKLTTKKYPKIIKKKVDGGKVIAKVEEKKPEEIKIVPEPPKVVKKEKKKPPHVTPAALLSDMTSLFSTPDVIRRVSTDNKKEPSTPTTPAADDKFVLKTNPKLKTYSSTNDSKLAKTQLKEKKEKLEKEMAEEIPQLDEAVLANLFSEAAPAPVSTPKDTVATIGPLSPSLELLNAIQPEEEGLTEDLLMHVAHLVESNENLQEVIDKQVLGKVPEPEKSAPIVLNHSFPLLRTPVAQTSNKQPPTAQKQPIQIIRSDGRVITLPPIEAPATRASKRKNLNVSLPEPAPPVASPPPAIQNQPSITLPQSSLKYSNKKVAAKKPTTPEQIPVEPKVDTDDVAESDTSWNSEDDPYRLWCICKQPHNNRFMICCDYCEDWFHGKCVNITKAMGQQMEEQGIEWNCPNCREKRGQNKSISKVVTLRKPDALKDGTPHNTVKSKAGNCIVCKKAARASSIYCSDVCILKHAQDSANVAQTTLPVAKQANSDHKAETRVIVYERETGRCLAGPSAPTAANLKMWLQQHPTFEVVRPGTLNAIRKPVTLTKSPLQQKSKIQTTLKIGPQKQIMLVSPPSKTGPAAKPQFKHSGQDSPPVKKEGGAPGTPQQQTNMGRIPKLNRPNAPKPLTVRTTSTQQSPTMKSPPPAKRREEYKQRSESVEVNKDITSQQRNTVKKSLIDQMTQRMAETTESKLTPEDIKKFVYETEMEMFDLIKDTNKYKAKYRSLVFNIGDKKNKSLWQKICERTVTPKQLVRLSPEELASQELAQWRDKEVKHQLELIKKSELDLLSCAKTYVLKTHKGEEVMESRTSAPTELDPNVSVEDLVTALNDPEGTASTPTKVSGHDRSYEQYKNSKHKNHHKTPKKSRKDRTPDRKEEKQKSSKDDGSSHKKSHKHASAKNKERESDDKHRRSSHKDRHKDKDRSSRAKSKERPDSSEKKKEGEGEENGSKSRGRSGRRSRSRGRSERRSRSGPRSEARSERRSRSKAAKRSALDSSRSEERKRASKSEHERSASQESSDKSKACSADVHPEYDPHVAMVTSALSEEDVRRSKDDSFDDSSANDLLDSSTYDVADREYDPAKSGNYSIVSSTPIPASAADAKTTHRLSSGTESDQEPSSTVDSIPNSVWNGCINMVDVAKFFVTAHEVSGNCADLGIDLTSELSIVGRINPDTVWDYIIKMKKSGNKDIIVLRLTAANVEERMQYIALYSYLSSRNRLGVVEVSNTASVKDFYIVPLSSHAPIPTVLLPLSGPGFEDIRPHLLIGVILRQQKRKRSQVDPSVPIVTAKIPKLDPKITSSLLNKDPSYTPPTSPRVGNVGPSHSKKPSLPPLPALSSSVKDKIAASLAAADDDNEPYSPGGSDSSKGSESNPTVSQAANPLPASIPLPVPAPVDDVLSRKLQELDRKIAEERKQIITISKNITPTALDEPYSPSRPMTPSSSAPLATLSGISLPSNLHEILANIQKKTRPPGGPADVDMRLLAAPPAPRFGAPPPFLAPPAPPAPGKLSSLSEAELLSMVPADAPPDPYVPAAAPPGARLRAPEHPARSRRKRKSGTDERAL